MKLPATALWICVAVMVGLAGVGGLAAFLRGVPAQAHVASQAPMDFAVPGVPPDTTPVVEASAPEDLAVPISETPPPASPPETHDPIVLTVGGRVQKPDTYTLHSGDRVEQAIQAAGGLADDADTSDINFAAPLIDGSVLTIPRGRVAGRDGNALTLRGHEDAASLNPAAYTRSGWRPAQVAPPPRDTAPDHGKAAVGSPVASGKVNLNTASQAELETLPGIGPKLAEKIMQAREGRRFKSFEDLAAIPGFGPRRIDSLRESAVVD